MPRGTKKSYFKKKNTRNKKKIRKQRQLKKYNKTKKHKQRRTRKRTTGGWGNKCQGDSNISNTRDCKPGKFSIILVDDEINENGEYIQFLVWGMAEREGNNPRKHVLYALPDVNNSELIETKLLLRRENKLGYIHKNKAKFWKYVRDIDRIAYKELTKKIIDLAPTPKAFSRAYILHRGRTWQDWVLYKKIYNTLNENTSESSDILPLGVYITDNTNIGKHIPLAEDEAEVISKPDHEPRVMQAVQEAERRAQEVTHAAAEVPPQQEARPLPIENFSDSLFVEAQATPYQPDGAGSSAFQQNITIATPYILENDPRTAAEQPDE
tara:strand:- start:11 stop:982 length:972 start_codon:yes stop_codon:yes gene_type:complete